MKNILAVIILSVSFLFMSCKDNPIAAIVPSIITANSQIATVMARAKADFSPDAKLAGIYGLAVATDGTIDLLKPTSNIFVYVVQSDIKKTNSLYIPVYLAGPIKSPIGLDDMKSVISDSAARATVGGALGLLSSVAISDASQYTDSPAALNKALANGGSAYMSANPDTKVHIYLLPSKTLSLQGLVDSADWVVNFSSNSKSLVLWINSGTGVVVKISG